MRPHLGTPEEVAVHLDAKSAGNGKWTARCPAHDDRMASLSLGTGDGGKVLLHCHAGCSFDAITAAITGLVNGSPPRFGELGATYDYIGEDGALLFQVQRDVDKKFRQRRPNVGRDPAEPAWIYDLKGVRRVLYRLPEVLTAKHAGLRIYIVEGEKDADRIASLGLAATTNPGGAGKWRAEHTETFKGVGEAVIIPDNDEPGRKHAHAVAEALSLVVGTVRVLELPEIQRKGADVSDWIDGGGGRDGLERLANAAPIFTPAPAPHPSKQATPRPVQGREVAFRELEPWPERVDGATLLDEIVATLRRFLSLPEGAAEGIALWSVFAHAHDFSTTSPLLAFTSPAKRCGKTTALQIVGEIVPRPLHAANVTPAAVFRSVDKYCPTLLVDEADTFLRDKDELRGVLNSGHSKRSARLIRTVGDHHEVRSFSTWSPKAVALIGAPPETLEDRAIAIAMKRRAKGEKLERLRNDRLEELEHLARKAATWSASAAPALRSADPEVPDALDDRAADNWRPLLAIADKAGGDWPKRARRAALMLSGGRDEDAGSRSTQLLSDVRQVFEERSADRLSSKALADALKGLEDRPWADMAHGRGLSPNGLARLLAPFGIRPVKMRLDGGPLNGYERSSFEDEFARYLAGGGLNRNTGTTRTSIEEAGSFNRNIQPERTDAPTGTGTEGAAPDAATEGRVPDAATGTETPTGTGFSAPALGCSSVPVEKGERGELEEGREAYGDGTGGAS